MNYNGYMPMCWVRDLPKDEQTDRIYVEYYCPVMDYRIIKRKDYSAPPCFKVCEKWKK